MQIQVTTFPVKYCKKCEQAYEIDSRKKLHYHDQFPTLYLERETCKNCK